MTTTHRTKISFNDEAIHQRSARKMQVFLRVPAQSRTLLFTVQGSETIQELQAAISLLVGVPTRDVTLTLKGASLKANLVKADVTITVLFRGLQGGSEKANKSGDGEENNASVADIDSSSSLATLKMKGKTEYKFNPKHTNLAQLETAFKN